MERGWGGGKDKPQSSGLNAKMYLSKSFLIAYSGLPKSKND